MLVGTPPTSRRNLLRVPAEGAQALSASPSMATQSDPRWSPIRGRRLPPFRSVTPPVLTPDRPDREIGLRSYE
jgi:hypothetical protein